MANTAQRPGIVMVAAILMMVYGGYVILESVVNIFFEDAIQGMMKAINQGDILAALNENVPHYKEFQVGNSIVLMVLGVLAVIVSIGLLKLRPACRALGMSVAWGFVVATVASAVFTAIFVVPATNQFLDQQAKILPPGPEAEIAASIGKAVTVSLGIVSVIFNLAIWLTIFFLLKCKTSRDAFAGKMPPEAESSEEPTRRSIYAGYDDEEDLPPPLPKSPPDTGIKE